MRQRNEDTVLGRLDRVRKMKNIRHPNQLLTNRPGPPLKRLLDGYSLEAEARYLL
jgi:hypothetical protein